MKAPFHLKILKCRSVFLALGQPAVGCTDSSNIKMFLQKVKKFRARNKNHFQVHAWTKLQNAIKQVAFFVNLNASSLLGGNLSRFKNVALASREKRFILTYLGQYQTLPLGSKSSICHEKNRFYNCIFLTEIWKVKCWTVNNG